MMSFSAWAPWEASIRQSKSHSETVCIKLLHKHLMEDATFAKRFQREAMAASQIEHPNCIRIIDFGQTDNGLST